MTAGCAPSLSRDAGSMRASSLGAAVRAFLVGYAVTLTPMLAALCAFEVCWIRLGPTSWTAATVALVGWSAAVAAWLRCRRWAAGSVDVVVLAPALVLAGPLSLGWLTPAGSVLWGPASTLLTVALALSGPPPESGHRPT